MPGMAFHITARTQGKLPWFEEPLRDRIEQHIQEGVQSSDARLLAHAVMPNHFHMVIRQGMDPLGWIMQPIMRRIALLVQRRFDLAGHVFERRFRTTICENAEHVRRAIIYTHVNPEHAGICATEEYRWSSAVLYAQDAASDADCPIAVAYALKLFGDKPNLSDVQLRACYRRYLAWRVEKDRREKAGERIVELEPIAPAGDAYFLQHFCAMPPANRRPTADLRDKAMELLRDIAGSTTVDILRRQRLNRSLTEIRRQLIASLLQHHYRVIDIARFLRISDSAVSRIAIHMRYARPQ